MCAVSAIYISHETNGKADSRTRSGIASELLFYSSHCRFVVQFNKYKSI